MTHTKPPRFPAARRTAPRTTPSSRRSCGRLRHARRCWPARWRRWRPRTISLARCSRPCSPTRGPGGGRSTGPGWTCCTGSGCAGPGRSPRPGTTCRRRWPPSNELGASAWAERAAAELAATTPVRQRREPGHADLLTAQELQVAELAAPASPIKRSPPGCTCHTARSALTCTGSSLSSASPAGGPAGRAQPR